MDLHGKVALVTGSATGMGRAIALELARAGANVAVNYTRSEVEARQTLADVQSAGVRGLLIRADVSDDAAVRAMVGRTVEELGRLDVLVNNAGTTVFVDYADLEALTDDVWRKILGVNVMGTFYASRAAAKVMLEQKSGCIVNMASVSGLSGLGSSIPYSVSKAGVISLTKTFARALAPHVRVNAIAPGVVDTRWVEGRTEFVERARSRTPFGRVATPADVAEVALALVTNAGFVTGQVIVVDGGLTI